MFFPDLSPYCSCGPPTGLPGVFNVGWLGAKQAFPTGDIAPRLIRAVRAISEQPVFLTGGQHVCHLCNATGNGEIWIRDDTLRIYASPVMISHYIELHGYLPPQKFRNALLQSAYEIVSEKECSMIIRQQLDKLEHDPSPDDILCQYFNVEIYWARSLFSDLMSFRDYLDSQVGIFGYSGHIRLDEAGFCVVQEGRNPPEILEEIVRSYRGGGPGPYKCVYTPYYLQSPRKEILVR